LTWTGQRDAILAQVKHVDHVLAIFSYRDRPRRAQAQGISVRFDVSGDYSVVTRMKIHGH
jgi:hypothetical protein